MSKQSISATEDARLSESQTFLLKRVREGAFMLMLTCACFILLALITYDLSDPGLFRSPLWQHHATHNAGGLWGAYIANFLYGVMGYLGYGVPMAFGYFSWLILKKHASFHSVPLWVLKCTGLGLMVSAGAALLVLCFSGQTSWLAEPGGMMGQWIALHCYRVMHVEGSVLCCLSVFLIGVTWLTGISWIVVIEGLGRCVWQGVQWTLPKLWLCIRWVITQLKAKRTIFVSYVSETSVMTMEPPSLIKTPISSASLEPMKPRLGIAMPASPQVSTMSVSGLMQEPEVMPRMDYAIPVPQTEGLPGLELLEMSLEQHPMGGYTVDVLEQLSRDLEQHLLDFSVQADVVAVHPGPVITRFELQLAAGVKASRLTSLSKDLARSLSVMSVRVVEIIPGKTVVGLEVPNPHRMTVGLSQVLSSMAYQQAHSPLALALGVDIAGHPMVVDLAKMPHLLVAGTTGSGKSVGINGMILSLLFRATPEQVRLILVDPKMLELSVYDGIPHLLTPVVTDMKEAASALRWCVAEMERRYRLMAALGVRHMLGYNTLLAEAKARGEAILNPLWKPVDGMDETPPALEPLPYIVVIIDELADMMMVVGKKVEQLIARIAQKARASGIHLILATQRPSVDVLTGLIKSNIPTRISFQVSSKIDSRTILDQQGAEQLLGHGDMLFLAPGTGTPLRVHGAFVDDKEVHRVAHDWRARGQPQYVEEILAQVYDEGEKPSQGEDVEQTDALYDEAVEFILQTRKASISSVQRRFKIGYNRAARLVEEMEKKGIVGPLEGGFRDVLVHVDMDGA